jgi:hypothetical protein
MIFAEFVEAFDYSGFASGGDSGDVVGFSDDILFEGVKPRGTIFERCLCC